MTRLARRDSPSANGAARRRHAWVVPALAAGAAALFVVSVGYACPIRYFAGVPCPTCGITRAVRLVLHGDFAGATRLHPLVWLAVPVVTIAVAIELVGYARTGAWGASRRVRGADAVMATTAALLFALWLARFAGVFGGTVE